MQLSLTLGGWTGMWRFAGSSGLDRWLRTHPWRTHGGMRVCRIRSADILALFSTAVRQAILAHDEGRSLLRLCVLGRETVSRAQGNLEDVFLDRLEVSHGGSQFERLCEAARLIEGRPTVFIVESGHPELPSTAECATAILDRVEKVGGQGRPAILVLALAEEPALSLPDDFVTGYPADGLLAVHPMPTPELWRAYLHQRIAWEVGGDPTRAMKWEKNYNPAELPFGRDDIFEQWLNRAAEADYAAAPLEIQQRFEQSLGPSKGSGNQQHASRRFQTELAAAGLLWAPDNGPFRTTPWAARGLLRLGRCSHVRGHLRNSLVCAPLAREILFACFDMEAWERSSCSTLLPEERFAPEEARNSLKRFQHGDPSSEYIYYPPGCPAEPRTAWCFSTFGDILKSARLDGDQNRRHWQHELRCLRNTLSHGHYVCWKTVTVLKEMQRELGFLHIN